MQKLSISHEREFQVLDAELDVEVALQKESISNVFVGFMAERKQNIGMMCVSEVGLLYNNYQCNSIYSGI